MTAMTDDNLIERLKHRSPGVVPCPGALLARAFPPAQRRQDRALVRFGTALATIVLVVLTSTLAWVKPSPRERERSVALVKAVVLSFERCTRELIPNQTDEH